MISVFIFVFGVSDSIFDSDKVDGNKNDKSCFRPFPFHFQVFNWLSATAFAYVAAVQLIDFLRILIYKI
jgi:hypothetical protein